MNVTYPPIVKITKTFQGSDFTTGTAMAGYPWGGAPPPPYYNVAGYGGASIVGVLPYDERVWDVSAALPELKEEGEILGIVIVSAVVPPASLSGITSASVYIADSDFDNSNYNIGDIDCIYAEDSAANWSGPPAKDIIYQSEWLGVSEGESSNTSPIHVERFDAPIPYKKISDIRIAPVLRGVNHSISILYRLEVTIMVRVFR